MRKKHLTIRDIARLTGFSRSTVSLVLNDSPLVKPATREKILHLIKEVDYHPNVQARGLASRRPKAIAVVLPAIRHHLFSDYYYPQALGGIIEYAVKPGYDIILEVATKQFVKSEKYLRLFKTHTVRGMLFIGASEADEYILKAHKEGFRVMLVNSVLGDVPAVAADNESSARLLIQHLAKLGHRSIALIGAPQHITTSRHRIRGYRLGLREAGINLPKGFCRSGNWTEPGGYRCARILLQSKPSPTAIVAANDLMAIGAMRAARDLGFDVPDDVSIVGADDISLAAYTTPSLTTFRQPIYEIGRLAMESLLKSIIDNSPPMSRLVPTELILRDSSARPPSVYNPPKPQPKQTSSRGRQKRIYT